MAPVRPPFSPPVASEGTRPGGVPMPAHRCRRCSQAVAWLFDARGGWLRLWQVLCAAVMAVVLVLALAPAPPQAVDLGWDKANHLGAFAVMAVLWTAATVRRWRLSAAGLLAFGALIEVLQAFTPNRSAEWADLGADALGIALGLGLSALLARAARLQPS